MDQQVTRRVGLALAALVAIFLIPALTAAQTSPPAIPHSLEGRDACLACHETGIAGAPQVPADHSGRTNDMCRGCHQPTSASSAEPASATEVVSATVSATAEASATATVEATPTAVGTLPALPVPHPLAGHEDCLQCHTSPEATAVPVGGPPAIPHTLVGREKCLACHQEGVGGAPRIPSDHAGRTNDVCQACHQPSQVPAPPAPPPPSEPLPTPVVHPQAAGGANTCFDCHTKLGGKQADLAAQWQRSSHAERNVACADCHGGDPSADTVDAAMSPKAGFIGVPAKSDVPALCASCHADVTRMRQYNLPTDQYDQYKQSVHGMRLAKGDLNVATCFDCHGGHQVLKPNDPASTVYPANVPGLCAGCHSNQTLMAAYNIPTDQLDLYRQSVHGHALLDNQDFRAPTCATCHGTHGAAPPGLNEVANVCGTCHAAAQDDYLKSPHAKAGAGAPQCVTCHGRHDVGQPSEALFQGSDPRHCSACHAPGSAPGQVAQSLYDAITSAAQAYDKAEAAVQSARLVGMLVAPMEGQLREANTDLITARGDQHTLDIATVQGQTDQSRKIAVTVQQDAQAAVSESVFRREAMVVAVVVIGVVIVTLYLVKRELDRKLDADR
jgi:hypothetical protein